MVGVLLVDLVLSKVVANIAAVDDLHFGAVFRDLVSNRFDINAVSGNNLSFVLLIWNHFLHLEKCLFGVDFKCLVG